MNKPLELSENTDDLRNLVMNLSREIKQLESKVSYYEEYINLLLHKRFGANSEKYRAEQADLFNEAEVCAEEFPEQEAVVDVEENELSAPVVTASERKRVAGRQALPTQLPRLDIIHELPELERFCTEGHPLKAMGTEVSEQLDIIPAKIQVLRHIRVKYACPCCQGSVKIALLPAQPIPKSNASPGLLAYVSTSKFLDALPLYRQSKQFERIGVSIPRATLASWMIRSGELAQPLINLMQDQLKQFPFLQMDETTVQVLKEEGRSASSQSYIWVRRGGPPDQPVVLFDYAATRSQAVADQLLHGFTGALQTDGYAGYAGICVKHKLQHAGCWAHVRRKFDEALKAQGVKGNAGKASKALTLIQKLYRVEILIKDQSPEEKRGVRQEKSLPILNELKIWLDTSLAQVTPTSLTGKALHYMANQWSTLTVYCENGRVAIDNNAIERAIRPFVIGRNNWIFSDTVKGVKASANLYSLIETAKLNGLEPYRYLRHVFTELPKATSIDEIEALLPWAVNKDIINDGWYRA